jgi:hypothetical protein
MTNQCAFVFYRLEELVNMIVTKVYETMLSSFEFTFKGEFCTLECKYDVKSLIERFGDIFRANHISL